MDQNIEVCIVISCMSPVVVVVVSVGREKNWMRRVYNIVQRLESKKRTSFKSIIYIYT